MPRVVQTTLSAFHYNHEKGEDLPSIPILLTSVTIVRIFSNPDFLPARSLHAAPIQNRVEPFAFASRAASRTGSMSTNLDALVGVL
jgi:hypothetical protein